MKIILFPVLACLAALTAEAKPNVIIIYNDDQGYTIKGFSRF